jgi:putative transposase
MSSANRTARKGLSTEDLSGWPTVNDLAFDEKTRAKYRLRKKAIDLYAAGTSLAKIKENTGFSKQLLYHLVDRCCAAAPDGRVAGYRALVPYSHLAPTRSTPAHLLTGRKAVSGALLALFARYPNIRMKIERFILHGTTEEGNQLKEVNPPINSILLTFHKLCLAAGIKSPHYPFNSESKGRPAITRLTKAVRVEHLHRHLSATDPAAARKVKPAGEVDMSVNPIKRLFQATEADGHKIDINISLTMPSPNGAGVVRVRVTRIWIIAIVEILSRAVLGYALALGHNYSGRDVMRALRAALTPWKQRTLVVPDVAYRTGDGLPNGVIKGLEYACFDEFRFDNAKSHLGDYFLGNLERTVGAVPVFGAVGDTDARPYIESFFNLLEESGLHRMPSTTGSGPTDPRGKFKSRDSDYDMSYEALTDLIDLVIARINNSPVSGTSDTRLAVLRRVVDERTTLIRRVPIAKRDSLFKYDICEPGIISNDHGRPTVRFEGARYTSPALSGSFTLIGKKVDRLANSDDMRQIECVLKNGSSLGILHVERRWRNTKHSLKTRTEIKKLENRGELRDTEDIVRAFRTHVEKDAKKSKVAATVALRLKLEQASAEDNQNTQTEHTNLNAPQEPRMVAEVDESVNEFLKTLGAVYR